MLTLSTCVRRFAYRQRVTAQRVGCRVLCQQQGRWILSMAVAQLLLTSPASTQAKWYCARGQRSKTLMSLKCCRKDSVQTAGEKLGQCQHGWVPASSKHGAAATRGLRCFGSGGGGWAALPPYWQGSGRVPPSQDCV